MNKLVIFLFFILIAAACNTSGKKNPEYLTPATGRPGDMLVIMDSMQWHGPLGEEVRKVFKAEVPGLPRPEPMFNLIWIHPSKNIHLLTEIRNLVFVFTLDQKSSGSKILRSDFTPETLAKIKNDTSFYRSTAKDEYSKGQEVMYLFGDTQGNLIKHLKENSQSITDFFNAAERERMEANIFKTKSTKGVTAFLRKEQQCELHVPVGYKLVQKTNDFIWLRNFEAEIDKDVFISWKSYETEYQLLPDSIIAWRNAIAKKYLFDDPDNPTSYLVTETSIPFIPVTAHQLTFNGHYAMELRGLWKTNNMTMGGPFISYTLIDQPRGLIYYIEGFTYSPSKSQREIIRELQTTLYTFRTSDQLDVKK